MFNLVYTFLTVTYLFNPSICNVIWDTPNALQPVHGLYVKPSVDGTTGDLYVAASEDNGVKSQWLTDQPVNFLPASSHNQQQVPVQFSSTLTKTSSPHEESITSQRKTVITSPPVRYAYALPIQADGNYIPPYSYALPGNSAEGSNTPYCTDSSMHTYSPYQYFYPPMMSAMANAMNTIKENTKDGSQYPAPFMPPYWPPSYGYPYQYVMVDPKNWPQNQSTNQSNSAAATSSENS